MLKKINLMISKFGIWIFVTAAAYKFTFWIIDMVKGFKADSSNAKFGSHTANGVYNLFNGLFGMLFYLVILAVLLEVSRKIAEKYSPEELAAPPRPQNNYNGQAPYPPQMQIPPQASVPPRPPVAPPQAPSAPVQTPAAPVQAPAAPVQAPAAPQSEPTADDAVWYCSGCGAKNAGDALFCSNCGKPK